MSFGNPSEATTVHANPNGIVPSSPGLRVTSYPLNALVLAVSLALLVGSMAYASAAEAKLTGIVCQNGRKFALLEVAGRSTVRPILGEGKKAEGIEVKSIDEKDARVTVLDGERTVVLSLGQEGVENQTFNFKGADSSQLLEVYQETTGRTVLRSPGLIRSHIDLKTAAGLSPVEAEAALAGALQEKGTVVTMRHDKFAFAVPFSYVPRLASIPAPPAPPKPDDKTESFPPGLIKFNDASQSQVLEIYQELSDRTLLYAADLPDPKITVETRTVLSRAEAMWTVETLLRLGGITLVTEDKFVFVVRTTRATTPPAVSSNSGLAVRRDEILAPGSIKFADAAGAQVLPAYAKLIGREAVSKDVPACRFRLRSQTPLTSGEAIYALDAAAALNGVRFVVTDKEVRLVPVARLLQDAAP